MPVFGLGPRFVYLCHYQFRLDHLLDQSEGARAQSDHVPARAYCGQSPAWELLKDPAPRFVLSCMLASAAHLGRPIGYACLYSNGPACRPRSNIRHRREAFPRLAVVLQRLQAQSAASPYPEGFLARGALMVRRRGRSRALTAVSARISATARQI
jgi:hypothetical protein